MMGGGRRTTGRRRRREHGMGECGVWSLFMHPLLQRKTRFRRGAVHTSHDTAISMSMSMCPCPCGRGYSISV